jgi:hypothetical protein
MGGIEMRLAVTSIALLIFVSSLVAAPIQLLVEEDGTTDAGTIGELTGGDSDPNGLGVLSNGTIVYFESDTAAGAGADDAIVLYDDDAAGGGLNRFTVIASEEAMLTAAGLASTENLGANDIAVGDNDSVYLLAANFNASPDDWYIFRIPNLGGNSFGPPEIAANPTGLGSADGSDYSMCIDTSTNPDTLIIGIDDNVVADDTSTNGIYTMDASLTNGTPTMIGGGTATLGAVSVAVGGIAGTDKGTCTSMTVIPGGNVIVSHGNSTAGVNRGDIVEVNRTTGATSLWVDASAQGGTPTNGVVRYNSLSGMVGVFWNIGTSSTQPDTDDRIEEFTTAGVLNSRIATEPDIEAVQNSLSSSTDLLIYGNAFCTDGTNYYIFTSNNFESLFLVPQALPVELSVFSSD